MCFYCLMDILRCPVPITVVFAGAGFFWNLSSFCQLLIQYFSGSGVNFARWIRAKRYKFTYRNGTMSNHHWSKYGWEELLYSASCTDRYHGPGTFTHIMYLYESFRTLRCKRNLYFDFIMLLLSSVSLSQ